MSPRKDAPIGDGERDAWLREALRHAPDADAAAPSDLSETILAQARAAARVGGAPARSVRRRNPLLALWDWLARPPVAAGFASVMVATLVGLLWWDRPMDETLQRRPEAAVQRAATSPQADGRGGTQDSDQTDRNLQDSVKLSEIRPPVAAAPAAQPAPSVGAIAPAPQPARQQRKEEEARHDDKAPANAAKVPRPQAPPPPQVTSETKEERGTLAARRDAAAQDRAAAKPSPFARGDEAAVGAAAPAKKTDSDAKDAKDAKASDGALGAAPADALAARDAALAKSKTTPAAPPAPAEVLRAEPPAAFGRERANEVARASPSTIAEADATKRAAAGAMSQATKQASAFEPSQAAQARSDASAGRAAAGAAPLAPIVAAIASDPARWSRSTSAGGVVALEPGWRDWLAQLDAAARGRWQPLGAADERARDTTATLRLVDQGRTTAVVRLEGTTVRVDAVERGERWQATLPPAAAERLRALAERLGR